MQALFLQAFSADELRQVMALFQRQQLVKNELFLAEGTVCKKVAFIETGAFTLSEMRPDGKEKMLDFFMQNDFLTDYYSFLQQTPATTNIRAQKDASLLVITKSEIDQLYERFPHLQQIGRRLAEGAFIRLADKLKSSHLTPFARYQKLLHEKPEVFETFPQYMIASYLDMSPEWLSKIRAQK